MTRVRLLLFGLLLAATFTALAGINLSAPGLYYDEVHQAPAAFTWLGRAPVHFCRAVIGGVAWMNLSYVGALKSALYGLFLRTTGGEFTILNWRMFGILLVAGGLLVFCLAAGRRLGPRGLAAFAALMLTDTTVLLTSRHDWGPTALSLLLRLLFLAVWIRSESPSTRSAFIMGLLVGLAIFDKTSSIVLLLPLLVAMYGHGGKRLASALSGVWAGTLPLAVVNFVSWRHGDGLISLDQILSTHANPLAAHFFEFLALGQGDWVRKWIMDVPTPGFLVWAELFIMLLLVGAFLSRPGPSRRLLVGYLLIGLSLWLLPRRAEAHHWILGTPFAYVAIAMGVSTSNKKWATALVILLLLVRLPTLATTLNAMYAGRTHERFDPSLTTAAKFAAAQTDAFIISATWGIANQVHCLAQGRSENLAEPVYTEDDLGRMGRRFLRNRKSTIYVMEVPRVMSLFPERTRAVYAAIADDPQWREVEPEAAVRGLAAVRVRKFVRPATGAD